MTDSKKLTLLRKEATVLLVIVALALLALISALLWALYSWQLNTPLSPTEDVAMALLDNKHTLLSATSTFDQSLLPQLIDDISAEKGSGAKYGVLVNPLVPSAGDVLSYHLFPDSAYTLITRHAQNAGDVRMRQFFFLGIGGFCVFGALLVLLVLVLIRRRIIHSMTELLEATRQAESADRAKSEFLACVSHELRTPLNAVIGYSEMLKGQMFGPLGHEKYREYAENVYISGSHLLKMINDILEISRAEAGTITLSKEEVTINHLVEECIIALSKDAKQHGVTLIPMLQEENGDILADAVKLQQAIMHILSNAVKFTPSGGVIHIYAEKHEGNLLIRVEDTGMGMSDEELAKAMQGYFSQVDSGLDRRFEGMGLGLSFARKLVELHGGKLMVESIKNKGTTVAMSIPSTTEKLP